MRVNLEKLVLLVEQVARETNWVIDRKTTASTGSTYLELIREGREWVVIRVSDHRQYYHKFLTTYSIDPSSDGLTLDELRDLLLEPFGEVGDVLL